MNGRTIFKRKNVRNIMLTGPGCKRNPLSCIFERGKISFPAIGGFSMIDLRELKNVDIYDIRI